MVGARADAGPLSGCAGAQSGKVGSTRRPAKRIVQAVVSDREQRRTRSPVVSGWPIGGSRLHGLRRCAVAAASKAASVVSVASAAEAHLQQAVSTALHADCARPDPGQRAETMSRGREAALDTTLPPVAQRPDRPLLSLLPVPVPETSTQPPPQVGTLVDAA